MKTLRIATRQSPLALWQAEFVASQLAARGVLTELVPLVSGGDSDMRPIDGTRQVGVFTKRIQQAVLQDEADVAVHSLKDLPTEGDRRLMLAAVPARETVLDALVSPQGWSLDQLPQGACVGTGSRRRAAQLHSLRRDLRIQPIRGNVQTRLAKLESDAYDAIVLAEAGIVRLEMHDLPRQTFPLAQMLPAPGQGALGIEVRSDDQQAIDALAALDDPATHAAVTAERRLLAALHGGCLAPIAAFAQVDGQQLRMSAVVLSQDGTVRLDETDQIAYDDEHWFDTAANLASVISTRLINRGAIEMVQAQR